MFVADDHAQRRLACQPSGRPMIANWAGQDEFEGGAQIYPTMSSFVQSTARWTLLTVATFDGLPAWLPVMEFPWWICFGTIVTFCVAVLFQTSREHRSGAPLDGGRQFLDT